MNLASIDLNLLVYLDALLTDAHVTNAGKRVGLSQSAMSRALSRLRDLFDDELLVKAAHGMVLSPKAQALAPSVRKVLRQIERTLDPDLPFAPDVESRTFTIATSPLCTHLVAAPLLPRLTAVAPGVRCALRPPGEAFPLAAMKRGELELVVSTATSMPTTHRTMELCRHELVTIMPSHIEPPRAARQWAELPHAIFHLSGDDFDASEGILSQLGLTRHVAAHLNDLTLARTAVDEAGFCVTLPTHVAKHHFGQERLHTPPIQLPPVLTVMHWSPHQENDAGNRWLRDLVRELIAPNT